MGWEEMTQRTCRELGGFDPDIRHRTNDATISLALVARGLAVTLLPDLAAARRATRASRCARSPRRRSSRAIFAVTRAADAARPVDAGAARRGARRGRGADAAGQDAASAFVLSASYSDWLIAPLSSSALAFSISPAGPPLCLSATDLT